MQSFSDGIYLALPGDSDANEFVQQINEKVNREGIKIDGEKYSVMFSIAKKSYALLRDDGEVVVKGGGLKSRATEPFLTEFISVGLLCLLNGDVIGLRDAWSNAVSKIQDGTISVEEISKTTRLSKSVVEYQAGHKSTQPQFEAAMASDRTDLKEGDLVSYYRCSDGWKLASEFDGDCDVKHYMKRLKQTAKRFEKGFTSTDFAALFGVDGNLLDKVVDVIRPQFRIVEAENKPWIELAHGIKLNKADSNYKIDRNGSWVEFDDAIAIDDFREKHNNIDLYCSQLAVMAPSEPVGDLSQHPRMGDFWLEFEGSKEDEKIMMQALEAAHLSYDVVEQLFGCSASIKYRYNGGKSLYLYVPMAVFEKEPTYNLHEKYKMVAQEIVSELPEELQTIPDISIYSADRLLRLEGSIYPDGCYDVVVPTELIIAENWDAIVALSQEEPVDNASEQKTELNHKASKRYKKLTKDVSDNPPKKAKLGKRKLKRKQARKFWEDHFGCLEIPCVSALARAAADGESIGFEGRNKLILESHHAGVDENTICELFLKNGDPHRYGVLEDDTRPDANPCGYRLRDVFNPFKDTIPDFDPSCKYFPQFCDPVICYRGEEFRSNEKFQQLAFDEFLGRGRNDLGAVMANDDVFATGVVTIVDASMSSGKTYLIALKGRDLTSSGYTVMGLGPNHDACSKIFEELECKHGGVSGNVIAVHLYCRNCLYRRNCLNLCGLRMASHGYPF